MTIRTRWVLLCTCNKITCTVISWLYTDCDLRSCSIWKMKYFLLNAISNWTPHILRAGIPLHPDLRKAPVFCLDLLVGFAALALCCHAGGTVTSKLVISTHPRPGMPLHLDLLVSQSLFCRHTDCDFQVRDFLLNVVLDGTPHNYPGMSLKLYLRREPCFPSRSSIEFPNASVLLSCDHDFQVRNFPLNVMWNGTLHIHIQQFHSI